VKPLKPATVPRTGEVLETTTRTRTLSEASSNSNERPDFWEYVKGLTAADWPKHMLYLYRVSPPPRVTLLKSADGSFTMLNNQRVSVVDQEELEFALSQQYGGGIFQIIMKKGPQIWNRVDMEIGGTPRAITIPAEPTSGNGATVTAFGDGTVAIASKAIDTVAGAEHQAVSIGLNAMATAANVIKSFSQGNGSNGDSEILRQLVLAQLQRNPMQEMLQFLTVLKELNAVAGGGGANGLPGGMMEKILGAMFERFMNPQPAQAPVNATAELIRNAPAFLQHLEGLQREQRLAIEAQTKARTLPAATIRPNGGMPQPAPVPNAAPTPGGQSVDFIEKRIVEIFQSPISAEAAADSVMEYLDSLDPHAIDGLANMGEDGLLKMFGERPILKACMNNPSRLAEFIRAFLRMHAEDEAEAQKQNAPKTN
jgi:hypothetical protein